MSLSIDHANLEHLSNDEDIEEHVFKVYTSRPPPESSNLGFITRSSELIEINLEKSQTDLEVRQSFSGESTGFLCWKTAPFFADWVLTDKNSPFFKLFSEKRTLNVVELGAGVSAVCAVVLGPKTANYIATDQGNLKKLFKHNLENNIKSHFASRTLCVSKERQYIAKASRRDIANIDFLEFDWEYASQCQKQYVEFSQTASGPDLIIACDVIYNEYLIPSFLAACRSLMSSSTGVIVGLQLRDENVLESFLKQTVKENFRLFTVDDSALSSDLCNGFAVYYFESNDPISSI